MKKPLEWRRKCLDSYRQSVINAQQRLAFAMREYERTQASYTLGEAQYAEAVKRGLTEYDTDRLLISRSKKTTARTLVTITVLPGRTIAESARVAYRKSPGLKVLREAVGGSVETVPHLTSLELDGKRVRCAVYANESGRLTGLPRNDEMSKLWKNELLRQDPRGDFRYEPELFGAVIIVVNANQPGLN